MTVLKVQSALNWISWLALIIWVAVWVTQTARGEEPTWNTYKSRFLGPEGRIIDTGNGGISHSEGQGYGMLLAEAADDRATFELLWQWTSKNLTRPDDHLFGWRWNPANGGKVDDWNDAADGDLLIAWALTRAGQHWQNQAWLDAAMLIARDVRTKLIRKSNYGLLLLPGITGFVKPDGCIVNLSYWIFPAFRALRKIDDSIVWDRLGASGLHLLSKGRFSSWKLPPDWLLVGGAKLSIAPGFKPTYAYDAVRIPLYLAWAEMGTSSDYESFRNFASANNNEPPASVSLDTGELGKDKASPGMLAIYRLIAGTGDQNPKTKDSPYTEMPPDESYFSASLGLLSNLAAKESKGRAQ
jgi:endoglucanase